MFRCAKFRFKPLAKELLMERLKSIAQAENVEVSDDGMQAMLETSEGDLRKAITTLQSCTRLRGKVYHIMSLAITINIGHFVFQVRLTAKAQTRLAAKTCTN